MMSRFQSCTKRFRSLFMVPAMAVCFATIALAEDGPNVGPGTGEIDYKEAALMFMEVCAQTNPDFTKGEKILRKLGFDQNTLTKTFYHPEYDFSVNLLPFDDGVRKCSFVMVGKSDPFETSMAFATTVFHVVPEAEREKTIVTEMYNGTVHATHPGIGTFHFATQELGGKHVFHAALAADNP